MEEGVSQLASDMPEVESTLQGPGYGMSDNVLVVDSDVLCNTWRLGRVVETS